MKYRNQLFKILPGLVVAICAFGCTVSAPAANGTLIQILQSDRSRIVPAAPDAARVPELVDGNTAFALDLYRVLFDQAPNSMYSPYSLSVALAMTYAGAGGETERQMAEVLHYPLPQAQLHQAFNTLDQALIAQDQETDEKAFELYMDNALWGQQGYPFLDTFLDTLAEHYGAGLRVVDFARTKEARQAINQWISEQTAHHITELLPPGVVGGETALVLTNAISFKAAWMHPFAETMTRDGTFTLPNGQQITVPMMHHATQLGYAQTQGVQAIELPYAGGTTSMVILQPLDSTLQAFVQELNAQKLEGILGAIKPTNMALSMPKFQFSTTYHLKDALAELGMIDAFAAGENGADFSGMDGTNELFIREVCHQAQIAVDEAGTEASAASAVVMERKGPSAEQNVDINQPFLFLIRDIETGTILFFGHVTNPATD